MSHLRFYGKRGATEYNAAWLIGIIGLFLLVYIILLPAGEKEKLIGERPIYGQPPGTGTPGGYIGSRLLFSETPGIIYPPLNQLTARPLASVNLFSFIDVAGQGLASSITVKRSAFSNQKKELKFAVKDVRQVQDAHLLFLVREGHGDLIVTFNGVEVFNGPVEVDDLPITLPVSLLKSTNIIEFSVSSPGINIFATNTYLLKDAQVFLKNLQQNTGETRTFVLGEGELRHLRHLTLFYIVNCFTVQEQGRLIILLNGRVISDGLVVCDAGPVALDLPPNYLVPGTNALQFEIDQGKYVLEQLVLEKEVGQQDLPRYVFTVQLADLQLVGAGKPLVLDLQFAPDNLRKIGTAYVNGFPIYVDTYDVRFAYDITGLIGPGTNIVRIVPQVPMDIASMNIGFAL